MTHLTDSLSHPLPESGVGVHSQESGDAGFSSNMEHKFSDFYSEPALGADRGSHVIPICTGGACDYPKRVQNTKMWSRPVFFPDSPHTVADEEGFIKPDTEAAAQKNFPLATEKNSQEKKLAKVTSETTPIIDKQQEGEVFGKSGGKHLSNTKMDNQAKPRRRPRGKGRKKRSRHTFCKDPKVYLFVMAAVLIPGYAGALPATDQKLECFSCNKASCSKLITIYENNDVLKYSGGGPFPQCSENPPPEPEKCNVCCNQSVNNITIKCSGGVGKLEIEDSDGGQIDDISPVACEGDPDRGHGGLIPRAALWQLVAALVFHGLLF